MGSVKSCDMNLIGHEDIAIVGMGCRLPGGVHGPEELWKKLAEVVDGWSEIPQSRFNPQAFLHPSASKHGSVCFECKSELLSLTSEHSSIREEVIS